MNYLHVLVGRWSRRDRLAVLVVALAAALLVGSTLLVVTAGEQTTALAGGFEANATVSGHDSIEEARAAASDDAVVLPTASARGPDGERTRAIGVPEADPAGVDLPASPGSPIGPVASEASWTLSGANGSTAIAVSPGGDSGIVPPSWIRTDPGTIEAVGPTGAIVVEPDDASGSDGADAGTAGGTADAAGDRAPLVGALSFFVRGTDEVLGVLWVGVAASAAVVAVTISSVVRTTIRERARTIRVARATGATPRRVRTAFALRAGLLAATGSALGYAIGVIVPNAAVNVAVVLGLPTTLSLRVTREVAIVLLAVLCTLTAIGAVAGYASARAATAVPPVRVGRESATATPTRSGTIGRVREVLTPTLLAPRTVVPTTATLAAFAAIVLMIASLGSVGASLAAGGATVTEPGAPHPVASQVPESYAGAMADRGVAASPEILLFASRDGRSHLARGVDFGSFASVTGAELVDGRAPDADDEAVVGTALADTLDLEPGDEVTIGGSTEAAFARVTVVGTYETGGLTDHQLLVPLATARHLSTVEDDRVNLIRTDGAAPDASSGSAADATAIVVGVETPSHVRPDESIPVAVTLWNPTDERVERAVTASIGDERVEREVALDPRERTTETIDLPASEGTHEVAVGDFSRTVTVSEAPPLQVSHPETAPPGEEVRVRVAAGGEPVEGATVAIDGREAKTDEGGTARVRLPDELGAAELRVAAEKQKGDADREATSRIHIADDAPRSPDADASIDPASPGVHSRPEATVRLWNPWNETIEERVTIEGPGLERAETVTLDPGEEATLSGTLARRPPGEYAVTVSVGGSEAATRGYRVSGDDRLTGALAASGHYGGGGGLGGAIEHAVGNLRVLLSALVGLAAITVVGATSAVLARAVRARRRTLGVYRATGASPRRVFGLVLADAARIGIVSSALALALSVVALEALSTIGRLTAFGIALDPRPSIGVAIGIVVGGVALTLLSSVVATRSIVRSPPRAVLAGRDRSAGSGPTSRETSGRSAREARRRGRPAGTDDD